MLFTKDSPFPDPTRDLHAVVVVNSANLPSAVNDGRNLVRLLNGRPFRAKGIHVLCDDDGAVNRIKAAATSAAYDNVVYKRCLDGHDLAASLSDVVSGLDDCDL